MKLWKLIIATFLFYLIFTMTDEIWTIVCYVLIVDVTIAGDIK